MQSDNWVGEEWDLSVVVDENGSVIATICVKR